MGSSEWHIEKRSISSNESPISRDQESLENTSENGSLSIVVLGASGDLAKKKTFPALFHLYRQGFLPSDEVRIFGYARTKISDDELRNRLHGYLIKDKDASPEQLDVVSKFLHLIKYVSGSYDSEDGFRLLDKEISEHESLKNSAEGSSRRLFYFALPPSVYPSVSKMIKTCCVNKSDLGGWTRIVVEKPFGKDLKSAEELSTQIGELFDEPQIYRIDHYLGKELVQNMLVLRFANRLFLPLWNRDNIANVQIVFREDFGTDGRGGYFDQYGIIRDIIQNHLLQVFCLVAMEKPVSLKPEHIRDEKVKVLQSVLPIKDDEVVLGQYEGYRDDPTVPDNSNTPTFASVILRVHNERWEGVPFIIKAGKALGARKADIRVQFKDVPGDIFKCQKQGRNEFVIRLQPQEAMYMKLTVKQPGLEMSTVQSELDLSYIQRYQGVTIPEAYERLILDTIRGDQQHFVRRDELKASWEIFTPLLHRIDKGEFKSIPYEPGSRGPAEADELLEKAGYVQTHGYIWIPPTL
ncbi:PREDICTED: glucose-6-phosphate 1-dehydrogenase, cytoplasmic isoform-like isoform X2 [Lupinus angustifolius]|uniref:glucose-6-phosphate 1-dehydrogenase, cytoplasmic isoform-like isoform X1 n=1 Tax=Lupinus angustifolius TaxID=3871 RepID=UPI00092F8F6F|nr:PREDICTED: glucose-6-phosphate 1-dehydrogenase, cytoplasmic isoform-like isoform X1 [Lupinus angustifolius]XP_019453032.1 PREDICTED: glucose-6-phosphate 1-dehydrogenase, cytoplasmic isoform-like isoform X1 [Lupinus angustifolius]XP_019453033.1 PREDICTED: glucose-6-phosphate 1-dehydrogenase, cytoplasmic isoform-like isoform X1 [Lupinus angustifolius]XP_019453034.1 PREDICTED: glucose-6-phosphate 1-dehydrogenase, cytoplasmic isoform-like isoform X2 [Lupinus angustifolius]